MNNILIKNLNQLKHVDYLESKTNKIKNKFFKQEVYFDKYIFLINKDTNGIIIHIKLNKI